MTNVQTYPIGFISSKLKVLFLGVDEKKHPGAGNLPRTYTLIHNDISSKLALAISQTINNSQRSVPTLVPIESVYQDALVLQGWYNKLYRDEVVA
ncbi:putative staygreen protein [Helianthus anomalus]